MASAYICSLPAFKKWCQDNISGITSECIFKERGGRFTLVHPTLDDIVKVYDKANQTYIDPVKAVKRVKSVIPKQKEVKQVEIQLIRQPPKSMVCGQSSVAMVAGITLEESIKLYGHNKATRMNEHPKVLNKLGIETGKAKFIDNRKGCKLPSVALVRIEKAGRRIGHLVVHCNGKFYDPAYGVFESKEEMLSYYNSLIRSGRFRLRWYMEVKQK